MARSKRLRSLQKDLRELRFHLLPKKFNPTGSYANCIFSRTIAYRVLAHAEIEAYLEDRTVEVVRAALYAWDSRGFVGITAMCLIAFIGRTMEEPPPSMQPTQNKAWPSKLYVGHKLKEAGTAFHHTVEKNHGIKEENVLRLLLPLGVDPNDIDPLWLATMNAFGERRGDAAHSSRTKWQTHQLPDPQTELETVEEILRGLMIVDELLNALI